MILTKIKGVDGPEPNVEAFVARYDLAYAEASCGFATWQSYESGLNAENAQLGPSQELVDRIGQVVACSDETLWLDSGNAD